MRKIGIVWVSLIASALYAAPQADKLGQQLRSTYQETIMDPNGMKVTKPGSTLVVQLDGLMANPRKNNLPPFENTFEDGQLAVTQGRAEKAAGRFGLAIPKRHNEKPVANGAKVYLLNVEFAPAADSVALTVQTCGDCDPKVVDPMNEPYRAKVTFKFVHGALAATDLKHVQQAIDQVFKFPDADTGATGAAGAGDSQAAPPAQAQQPAQAPPQPVEAPPAQPPQDAAPQQNFAPIAAPAAPPAPPKQIKLGMTIQEVKDGFGEPDSIVDLGSKVIYKYKDLKVTFVNGKVSDVE